MCPQQKSTYSQTDRQTDRHTDRHTDGNFFRLFCFLRHRKHEHSSKRENFFFPPMRLQYFVFFTYSVCDEKVKRFLEKRFPEKSTLGKKSPDKKCPKKVTGRKISAKNFPDKKIKSKRYSKRNTRRESVGGRVAEKLAPLLFLEDYIVCTPKEICNRVVSRSPDELRARWSLHTNRRETMSRWYRMMVSTTANLKGHGKKQKNDQRFATTWK